MNHDLNIKIAEALIALTKAHGRDAFLPGDYDRIIARQEARLAQRIREQKEAVA